MAKEYGYYDVEVPFEWHQQFGCFCLTHGHHTLLSSVIVREEGIFTWWMLKADGGLNETFIRKFSEKHGVHFKLISPAKMEERLEILKKGGKEPNWVRGLAQAPSTD